MQTASARACARNAFQVSAAARLRDDGLATAKRPGDRARAAEDAGEEDVKHALARQQRRVRHQLLRRRPRRPHRPQLLHAVLALLAQEVHLDDLFFDVVLARRRDPADGAAHAGRQHDLVRQQRVLDDGAVDVARRDLGPLLQPRRVPVSSSSAGAAACGCGAA